MIEEAFDTKYSAQENSLMGFIAKQEKDWSLHRKSIGFFGRLFENIFGSDFAYQQIEEYKNFCENHGFIHSL